MTLLQLERELNKLHELMDGAIDGVTQAAEQAQSEIYKYLTGYINTFQIEDGRFVLGQDYSAKFAAIQRKMNELIGDLYRPSISGYLNSFSTIEEINISLHKSFNQLELDLDHIAPARKVIYDQAKYFLTAGVQDNFVQPVKYLLMQQVTRGITIKDSQRILKHWDDGTLTGQLTSGRPTPRLQSYSTVIARDSTFQFNGTIQDQIQKEYDLDAGLYVGDVITDSRPACVWAVRQKRKILLKEITEILGGKVPKGGADIAGDKPFLSGLIPGTNTKNFPIYRFGYACRHLWMPVRSRG